MAKNKTEEKEYIGSDVEYDEQEKEKFQITRGMLIIAGVVFVIVIIIIILIKSLISKPGDKEKYTKEDFLKLERRMEEEAPIYINQKNIELTTEKIKILLDDLLTTNGGSIDPEKNIATEICDGYVIAYKEINSYYNAYINCGDKYVTDGYEGTTTKTTVKRTTTYKDDIKPDILIIGEKEIILEVGDNYVEPGYTATDNIDGDITSDVKVEGKVDTKKIGTYILTYKVKDKAGNSNEATRKVVVKEKQTTSKTTTTTTQRRTTITTGRSTTVEPPKPTTTRNLSSPTITLNGQRQIFIYKGESYKEPGYTAKDANGKDLTSRVNITGTVNINRSGVYTLTYNVTDDYGLSFSISRIITVKENSQIIYVSNITISPNSATVRIGNTLSLKANITPSNATNKSITWKSSNPSVASVSADGVVRGIKRGSVIITATSSNGKTSTSEILVN